MEILRLVLLFVHLVAIAGLLGGLLAQFRASERAVTATMLNSARVAFLAGLLLVVVLELTDGVDVNHAKIGTKLVVGFVIVGMLESNRKKPALAQGAYFAALALTLANVAVALFWSPAHGSY